MKIKIRKNEYTITEKDLFMDNGACIQLLTQSKERSFRGSQIQTSPILTKKVIEEINQYPHIQKKHNYGEYVSIFSIKINSKEEK